MIDSTRRRPWRFPPAASHSATARRLAIFSVAATFFQLILAHGACQKPLQPTDITAAEVGDEELDGLWNASLSVLRKFDFLPDRQDRATGVIECVPTTGKQWHEPWRQDVSGRYAMLESSLHTIQRKATVRFTHAAKWTLDVRVDVYRVSRPETQITSASSVLHGFAGLLPTEQGTRLGAAEAAEYAVHLGRDRAIEQRLLQRILDAAPEWAAQ